MPDKLKKFWKSLGPGLITGASDNDPAGIMTYAIAGARFGFALLWSVVYVLPFMIAVQKMSAHIGRLSSCGLAGNLKQYYPRWLLALVAVVIITANVLNVGANIYGMAGALNLLVPLDIRLLAMLMSGLILWLTIKLRYSQIVSIFKWLAMSLGVYIIAFLTLDGNWGEVLKNAFIPTVRLDHEFVTVLFAVLGTTLAPYMYFWQASEEAEEVRDRNPRIRICKFRDVGHGKLDAIDFDTNVGMIFSNVVAFFIIALMGATVFQSGGSIETLRDAADALEPLAGQYASLLFTLGVIGSGLLAIPVLAGSAGYVLAELFNWQGSLDKPFSKARQFYIVIGAAILVGLFIPFLGISPVNAMFYTGLINGLAAPLLLMLIIHMSGNKKIVGEHTISGFVFFLGCCALFIMTAGSIYILTA